MTSAPVSTTGSLSIEQATTVAPPAAGSCGCDRALYTCSSFPNWSAAQACFNQCRITVGYDIHGLDEDGDGVACEMAMDGPSPFTLPTLPAPVTSPVDTGAAPDGAAAPPLIQDTTPSIPTAAATLTAPVMAIITLPTPTPVTAATVTELPDYPTEAAASAEGMPAQPRSPMRALPWAIMITVVAVAAGALVRLRRRG